MVSKKGILAELQKRGAYKYNAKLLSPKRSNVIGLS